MDDQRRQLTVDIALAMAVLVVVGTAIAADLGTDTAEPGPASYAFGVLFAALLLVRRRWPIATLLLTAAALLVYYALDYPPIGLAVPVAAALYSAAEQGRLRWAIATAAALLAISTSVRIGQGDDLAYLLGFEFVSAFGLMAAVIALGDSVRARRGWRGELIKQAAAAEQERDREAARRVEQERVRIARDLHDILAHTVSVISLHTDVAREALDDDPQRAAQSLAAARAACSDVTGQLRATMRALRDDSAPDTSTPTPGADRIGELVATVQAAGVDVGVHVDGTPVALPALADAAAYRIVQEALSNVLRHAAATEVQIALRYDEVAVEISVTDDGTGSADPATAGTGWGIVGMRERLTLLGGTLTTHAPDGGGFTVDARIPLAQDTGRST